MAILVKKRSYKWLLVNLISTPCGAVIILGGLVAANVATVIESKRCTVLVFKEHCIWVNRYVELNVAMLVLGLVAFLMCVAYFLVLFLRWIGVRCIDRRENSSEPSGFANMAQPSRFRRDSSSGDVA
jgi:hypothetical protein